MIFIKTIKFMGILGFILSLNACCCGSHMFDSDTRIGARDQSFTMMEFDPSDTFMGDFDKRINVR